MSLSEPMSQATIDDLGADVTVRVSAREVRETTWRALVATGVSAGEAQVAAEAVAFGEMHLGHGVELVLRELDRHLADASAVELTGSDLRVLEGGAHRGILLLAPLAVGILAARPASAPVLLPGFVWNPAIIGFFMNYCGDGAPSFFAFEHREAALIHGCRVDSDTSFTIYDDEQLRMTSTLNPRFVASLVGQPNGIVIVSNFGGFRGVDSAATTSKEDQRMRKNDIFGHGVHVGRERWTALYEASKRYLAAEA